MRIYRKRRNHQLLGGERVPDYTITKLRANGTEERTLSSAITPRGG